MSRLSKQSIRKLCLPRTDAAGVSLEPMIYPFCASKVRVQGVSKGLSHASYDASIAHDLVLGRHPGYVIKEWALEKFGALAGHEGGRVRYRWYQWPGAGARAVRAANQLLWDLGELAKRLRDEPPAYSLAYTVEDFCMPANVGGDVADKSTFARVFVSAFNTFFDPGFHGNATLELVNQSDQRVEYKAGQGVCQFIFTWLDEATEDPYSGKYQHQTKQPQAARYENEDGTWRKDK